MSDLDREYASKIKHRLSATSRKKRTTEIIFLAVVLSSMSFLVGYVLGSAYPIKPTSKVWAEKIGRAKK